MNERIFSVAKQIKTPAFVADEAALRRNMEVAARLRREAGCRLLLATKAFALPAVFPMMRETLDGTTASGLYEARLGREDFGKEVHVYSPAYSEAEIRELLPIADHFYFNSVDQIRRFLPLVKGAGKKVGIRINPGYTKASEYGDLYAPCSPRSRFGVLPKDFDKLPWGSIDIIHAHALCESLHDGSVGLIEHVGKEFGDIVKRVKAVNFGGGHFICDKNYDVDALAQAIRAFRAAHDNVDVILEPGGGLVRDAGYLVATVRDILHNEKDIAVLDVSASCHIPDVLVAHFRPTLLGAAEEGVHPHDYILGGNTCMTGDIIGVYSFPKPLEVGDRLVFGDMLHYNFVQTSSFNGTPLPDIGVLRENGGYEVVRRFGYEDYRGRFGACAP